MIFFTLVQLLQVLHLEWALKMINNFTDVFLRPNEDLQKKKREKQNKNMNSVQQQLEHYYQKILIESFHLSGHTFRFRWTVQDLEDSLL